MGTNGASPGIGLRAWNGDGAIRVYRDLVTDDAVLLLLERCEPGQTLETQVPDVEQDEIVAGLLTRLWRHPGDGLGVRPLQDMCDAWADEFDEKLCRRPETYRSWLGKRWDGVVPVAAFDGEPRGTAVHRPSCEQRPQRPARAVVGFRPSRSGC